MSAHLEILKSKDESSFVKKVAKFIDSHHVIIPSIKFQRNLFYSLSGSTVAGKEALEGGKKLEQEYIAFILWTDV